MSYHNRFLAPLLLALSWAAPAAETYPSYQDYVTTKTAPPARQYLELAPELRVKFLASMRRYEQVMAEMGYVASQPNGRATLHNPSWGALQDTVTVDDMIQIMYVQYLKADPFEPIAMAARDRGAAEAFRHEAGRFRGLLRDYFRQLRRDKPSLELEGLPGTSRDEVDTEAQRAARGGRDLNVADIQRACNACHNRYTIH